MALLEHGASWRSRSPASSPHCTTVPPNGPGRAVVLGLGILAGAIPGCESKVEIATFSCPVAAKTSLLGSAGTMGSAGAPGSIALAGFAGAAGSTAKSDSFALPWSTGFETGFCDYSDGDGYCFSTGSASNRIVTEPVHSGSFAAAFTVDAGKDTQIRCVRKGRLPTAAYYSAWYYVPALVKNNALWNLLHFQGDNTFRGGHLWDVSLKNKDNGDLRLEVFSYLLAMPDQSAHPSIPIGSWFEVKMYLKLAKDETGEVIVYQDGAEIFRLTNVVTDNSPGLVEWYVGNLAEDLAPRENTLYVDDVTISETR